MKNMIMKNMTLLIALAAVVVVGTGCATSYYETGNRMVQPGPYAGVRTDVKVIGSLANAPKRFHGSEKAAVAMCVPFGAMLVAADIPLSLVADTCRLPAELRQAPASSSDSRY